MNRALLLTRIIVSTAVMLLLTAALTAPMLAVPGLTQGLEQIQLTAVVMSLSLFIFVVWIIITLVFGRIYCSSICPMGTLQDAIARAARMGKSAHKRRYRHHAPQNRLRYIMLVAMMVCLMGQYYTAASIIDPYGAYARICSTLIAPVAEGITPLWAEQGTRAAVATWSSTLIAAVTLAAVAVTAARRGRLLCNTVCPVGTTLGLVSRFSIFQIDIDTDKCIQCGRCEDVCKGECIDLRDHVVDGSRCINCFNCINVCPNDAIYYTGRRKQLSDPMMQRIPAPFKSRPRTAHGATGATCSKPENPSLT
ncbi:MAG: 4Fe-4S binding protein [Muribaculaceae bacterium]|nr:4Fe-4S binding protein [Muribaculaceae bacterium]